MAVFSAWIGQYGYLILFFVPFLEFLALPLPSELLLGYAGFLVFQGQLNMAYGIAASCLGSILGMTLAYWTGYALGSPFLEKYMAHVHAGARRMECMSQWFARHGRHWLVFAPFIPGIKHMSGYFSGISKMPFGRFMLYASSGAVIWVSTFIMIGKLSGNHWQQAAGACAKYIIMFLILAGAILFLVEALKKMHLSRNILPRVVDALRIRQATIIFLFTCIVTADFILVWTAWIRHQDRDSLKRIGERSFHQVKNLFSVFFRKAVLILSLVTLFYFIR